jgi:intracellular sulfur oxidation DsrE/DsrF family protein
VAGRYGKPRDLENKRKVQKWIEHFRQTGIVLEQCDIAARTFDVDPKDILPGIRVVDNGFVSMIGYQTKGYAVVPMDGGAPVS